jgi:hypothetical protein
MNKLIALPEGVPESSAEAYREFACAQKIQQLLVENGAGRFQAAMVLIYAAARCLEQIDHPVALQQGAGGVMEMFQGHVIAQLRKMEHDPVMRMRMDVDNSQAKLIMRAAVKVALTTNIKDEDFHTPSTETQAAVEPSRLILPAGAET